MNNKNINIILIISTLLAITATSCATRTKLGDLIPAHHLSDERDGEEVWVDIAPGTNTVGGVRFAFAVPALQLAGAAAGALIDYVKAQMQNEAARYDADFHNVAFSDTDTVFATNRDAYVLLTRWVKHSAPTSSEYKEAIGLVQSVVTNSVASSHTTLADANAFNTRIAGKSLAFAYCIQLDRARSHQDGLHSPPFLIKPQWKWQWLSKAKIVSLRSNNPLSWPAGLLLKTGSQVEYEVTLMLSALTMTATNSYAQMQTIGLKDPIQANAKFDLSGTNHLQRFNETALTSGWLVFPGYPTPKDDGYFGIGLAVKESDPSNVKTMLLQGSQYLENNKQNLINRIVGGQ